VYSVPLIVALCLYGVSTALYLIYLAGISNAVRPVARVTLAAAAAVHLLAIGYHHLGGLEPVITAPKSLINLAVFVGVAAYLVMTTLYRTTGIGGGILAPVSVVVLGTLINNAGVEVARMEFVRYVTPLHIAASALGFLFFGLAFLTAMARILADMRLKDRGGMGWPRLPPIASLDRYTFGFLRIGFPFYTLGLVLGAVWAYWGGTGDLTPEYLLGVGVWLLYAVLIYVSIKTGWRGRKPAVFIGIGFLATLSIVLMYAMRRLG